MSIIGVGSECCGCRTCKTVCKFNAISVVNDKYGFEQIRVDSDLCRECGMCEKVCPAINVKVSNERYSTGAAYALNDEVKYLGTSGGLFGVFANNVISDNGYVYGAAFDSNLKLKTTPAKSRKELLPLFKSKYLLCDTDNRFIEIKENLDNGKKVLYCSSPCQVAALKLYLGNDYDNLLTVDFLCHGVGSQSLFDKSIEFSEKKLSAKINKVIFRYKVKNASSHYYYRYTCEKNGISFEKEDLYYSFPYFNAYCKQLACRDCCYKCKYATEQRAGDITIGDFHTIEKYDSSINGYTGISMFVCNTQKGECFFNSVKDELFVELFPWEIIKNNNHFSNDKTPPKKKQDFRNSVANEPFNVTVKKYLRPSINWKQIIYYKCPVFIRNIAKKIKGVR